MVQQTRLPQRIPPWRHAAGILEPATPTITPPPPLYYTTVQRSCRCSVRHRPQPRRPQSPSTHLAHHVNLGVLVGLLHGLLGPRACTQTRRSLHLYRAFRADYSRASSTASLTRSDSLVDRRRSANVTGRSSSRRTQYAWEAHCQPLAGVVECSDTEASRICRRTEWWSVHTNSGSLVVPRWTHGSMTHPQHPNTLHCPNPPSLLHPPRFVDATWPLFQVLRSVLNTRFPNASYRVTTWAHELAVLYCISVLACPSFPPPSLALPGAHRKRSFLLPSLVSPPSPPFLALPNCSTVAMLPTARLPSRPHLVRAQISLNALPATTALSAAHRSRNSRCVLGLCVPIVPVCPFVPVRPPAPSSRAAHRSRCSPRSRPACTG